MSLSQAILFGYSYFTLRKLLLTFNIYGFHEISSYTSMIKQLIEEEIL